MSLDSQAVRSQFPALKHPIVYLDNPGGTQIARSSLEQIEKYLVETNANSGGLFETSQRSDALVAESRQMMADFLNAASPDEIVYGANMTTLTFAISRALGRTFKRGDTLLVTRLDHDGNISPWLLLAEDLGLKIHWVDIHPEDCTIDLDDFKAALAEKPVLAAFGYASNAVGTINPVQQMVAMAHEAGALTYIDAVQYAPHGPIDVQQLGTDFLVCSAYKFFGPHMGILYGRLEHLKSLTAYKVRPAPMEPPEKFETGTGAFEQMAGLNGALEYIEWLGNTYGEEHYELLSDRYSGRKLTLKQGMNVIRGYEFELSRAFIDELNRVPGLKLYGIQDERRVDQRVPTFSFTLEGFTPKEVAIKLNEAGISVWKGNFYALATSQRVGVEEKGGFVRVGATHYNTVAEIHHLGDELRKIVGSKK
jgi:cysteine desulfurase family protein (TIGR01976 family)